MKKMTIREIAQMANVSQTAVSFVLNNKPGVSDDTRKRVLEIIEKTNFQSDRNSKRLALNKSFNICLAYFDTFSPFNDLFYVEVAKAMIDRVGSYGYNIIMSKFEYQNGRLKLPEAITAKDADGVVIIQDVEPQILQEITDIGLPYIILDSYSDDCSVFSVGIDAHDYTRKAVQYLAQNRHEKIALIGSSFIPAFWQQVSDSYCQTMQELGLKWNSIWLQNTANDEDTAYECMKRILQAEDRPTAVFCVGDIYAIGAIRCIKNTGLRVPEDISVMGVDNIILGKYLEPALTTIDIHTEQMGQQGLDALMKRINGVPAQSFRMSNSVIVERDSVACRK